eukprot:scaffold3559_cov284-Chaetoceros_neogracile.AAC.40
MASEQIETPVAVEADATTATAIATDAAPAQAQQDGGKPMRQQRQRTPPEELFDLSKPIPKVEKPDKPIHDEQVETINSTIDTLKEKKKTIQDQIELALTGGKHSAAGKEREGLKQLRSTKGSLINEKKSMRARMDLAKKAADSLMNDRKAARSNVRFNDVESIEAEIKNLRNRQETTSMSLAEEKRLIKEIDALQQSKLILAELKTKDAGIDNAKEQRKNIAEEMKAKDTEIDAVQEDIDVKQKIVDAMKDTETEARKNLNSLKNEREEIRKEIGVFIDERNTLRDTFRESNDKWYDFQRAIKVQKKMKYDEEKQQREEEKVAWNAAKEAEEAKKIPYEEEMYLCEFLAKSLAKTYLVDADATKSDDKKVDVIAVQDDPFANFVAHKKNDDEIFLKMGKGKKPRVRSSKKKAAPVFKLNVDSFEQFGLLGLTPPTSLDMVQNSVDELKAKKEWYSGQARGSVPTAVETRKANEKAAQKLRQGGSTSGTKKNGKLDISSDDFAPLSAGGSTSGVNAMWGQKAPEEIIEEQAASDEEIEESVEASA